MPKRFSEILDSEGKKRRERGKNIYNLIKATSRVNLGNNRRIQNAESMTDVDGKEVKFSE